MKKALIIFLLVTFLVPSGVFGADFNPDFVISDMDMTNKDGMSKTQIQDFLAANGALGGYVTQDVDGEMKTAADIIHRVSQQYILNPKFIIAMLQKEQSLIRDDSPSQKQLDWATGYAVCDSCSMDDPRVIKYKGFANQVDNMGWQYRVGYLDRLIRTGRTQTSISPGSLVEIDGVSVVPANNATAAMYTYTPHIEGNENFWRIWQDWYKTVNYPNGSLLRDVSSGDTWVIQHGRKRLIESRGILVSLFDADRVIDTDFGVLANYLTAPSIAFPNYSLVRVDSGDVYLLVGEEKRMFKSVDELSRFGYQPDEIIDVSVDEIADYLDGPEITYDTAYPKGVLMQHAKTGSVYFVDGGKRHSVVSDEIRKAKFSGWDVEIHFGDEIGQYFEGSPVLFDDGTLVMAEGVPTVYVISDGKRRPILDEATFLGLGYSWDQIVKTNSQALEVHQPGELLSIH